MSIDEITKGWSPRHFKQEVSKMERIQTKKTDKRGEKASWEFEGKLVCYPKSQVNGFQEENCARWNLTSQVNNILVIGDLCKSYFPHRARGQSSNEWYLRKNRRKDMGQSGSHSFQVFSCKGSKEMKVNPEWGEVVTRSWISWVFTGLWDCRVLDFVQERMHKNKSEWEQKQVLFW